MFPPEIDWFVPCSVAPALIVVAPLQLLAALVSRIVPVPAIITGWLGSPIPVSCTWPVSVAVTPASARNVVGSAEAGASTSSRISLA